MPNPKPNTQGLKPFTPETAAAAAEKSAATRRSGEALKTVTLKIYERQHREIAQRGLNLSELVRNLLDQHLGGKS